MSDRMWRKMAVMASISIATTLGVPAHAQLATEKLLFQDITLSPNFQPDPRQLRGISGGTIAVRDLTGVANTVTGPCVGYVSERPDHQLMLTEFFDSLRLMVESEGDTAIVVRGPGGLWCNDDLDGKNPGAIGFWLPGTYEIWVASYAENQYYPYRIRLSEIDLPTESIDRWVIESHEDL